MSQKSIILVVILFVLLIVGMFTYATLKKAELNQPPQTIDTDEQLLDDPYVYIARIDGTHYFIDGVHTIVGEIEMPTPCDLLEVDAIVQESYPEQVILDFTVINTSEMCAQVVTSQRFKVSASASSEAQFSARLMGREVELNLTPAPEGESPDDFEVFIKG